MCMGRGRKGVESVHVAERTRQCTDAYAPPQYTLSDNRCLRGSARTHASTVVATKHALTKSPPPSPLPPPTFPLSTSNDTLPLSSFQRRSLTISLN
jgi:hypothetical protein